MASDRQDGKGLFYRLIHSWQAPAALAVIILIGMCVWMFRVKLIVPVDESESWERRNAPPRRAIVWETAHEIGNLLPEQPENAELITPRLTDNGATLYFTRRQDDGQADIFRSRLMDGTWVPGEPIAELNTPADEIAPTISHDGKSMYFYSNRPGGEGGYDIYMSQRDDSGWAPARNLGPKVNTLAHEYDPAISPDGMTLFFASNRTEDLHDRTEAQDEKIGPWTTTLRARLAKTKFDLYMARRESLEAEWEPARALNELNRPRSDEGAPFVSPNGVFLYFASDRPSRSGEDANLDLYRARRIGDRFGKPESLGPSVNTAAHETEPALSPEGYTLVFSSDREGHDRLYVSKAKEVYEETDWRKAHLPAISPIWWWALLITAIVVALLALLLYFRGLLAKKAYTARFFLGSVIIHSLLLLLLAYWTLPAVVEMIVTELKKADPSTEMLDESEHQSHEDGREAYEKVNDLQAVEKRAVPEMVRQVTKAISVPKRTEHVLPAIPLSAARRLPPNRVLFEPTEQPEPVQELKQLTRQRTQPRSTPLELAEVVEPVTEEVPSPTEKPIQKQQVDLNRQQPTAATPPTPTRPLPKMAPQTTRPAVVELQEPQPSEQPAVRQPQATPVLANRPVPQLQNVEPLTEEVTIPTPQTATTESKLTATPTNVTRTPTSRIDPTNPQRPATPLPNLNAPQPNQVAVQNVATADPSASEEATGREPISKLIPRTPRPVPVTGVAVTEEEPVAVDASQAPAELLVRKTELNLERTQPVTPKAGLGRTVDLPRRMPEPAEAKSIELASAPASPQSSAIPSPKQPEPNVQRQQPVQARSAAQVAEEVELTAVPAAKTDDNPTPTAVAVARSLAQGPAPTKPVNEALNQVQPLKARREAPAEQPPAEFEVEQVKPSTVANRVARTNRAAPVADERTQVETDADVQLSSAQTPDESPVARTEVQLVRVDATLPTLQVRTPKEMTGPASRNKHRIVVGALSEERNDAPPSFGPLVSRLNRRRARATRVAFASDNVGLRSMLMLRQGDTRKKYIKLLGGTDETEKAVNLGLEWLAKHQEKDGSWDLKKFQANVKSNTAATGMALLPFLAAGHTQKAGQYQQTVAKGLKWLVDNQKENGDLLAKGDQQHMYSIGIAAIPLCEAYGMTQDPELKAAAQKSLDFICKAQHQGTGGWRYTPNTAADTSVVGWQMMALKSGEMAGLSIPQKTLDNVLRWLASVEGGQKGVGGLFGYTSRGASPAMTAEGLLCLQFMHVNRNDPRMLAGADYLLKHLPDVKQSRTSYYWYYATQVMYHMQGKYWETWNERLPEVLVKSQVKNGKFAGTWEPRDQWEKRGGRIFATAMKLLMLEVYYRHLPLYEQLDE